MTNNLPEIYEKHSWKLFTVICILAAFFRLWGAFELDEHFEDELLHVTDAIAIHNYGTTENWGWHHPQLSGHILYSTITVFGETPFGRRISNICFSIASIILLYAVANILFSRTSIPLMASSMLAFDPHNIYISRTTYVEIPVTCFFLLYLYLLLLHTEKNRQTLQLAGIAIGLTIATKAYFVISIPLSICYALYRQWQNKTLTTHTIIDFIFSLLILPISIYIFSYYRWFWRGHTLIEFFQMKLDGVWGLKQLDHFVSQEYLDAGGKPWEWFLKPFFWGQIRYNNFGESRMLLQTNNIPFRIFTYPSLLFITWYALKNRKIDQLLPTFLFASSFLLMILAKRPMFSYSSTVLLPFAYLVTAQTIDFMARRSKTGFILPSLLIAATLLWCSYLFPIVSARALSSFTIYNPIFSVTKLF